MRNLFALVGAGTIAFVGLGWYLDWYRLSRQPSPAGTQQVRVDLNPDKTYEDVRKGIERVGEFSDRIRENSNSSQSQSNPSQQQNAGRASHFFSPASATP